MKASVMAAHAPRTVGCRSAAIAGQVRVNVIRPELLTAALRAAVADVQIAVTAGSR